MPVNFDLEKARAEDFSRVKVINLLRNLEFFSLLRRLPGYEEHIKTIEEEKKGKSGALGEIKWKKRSSSELLHLIGGQAPIKKIISMVFDVESNRKLKGLALAVGPNDSFYLSKLDEKIKKLLCER